MSEANAGSAPDHADHGGTAANDLSTEPGAEIQPLDDNELDEVDLEAIAVELDGVERALERLDDGSYWTDEVSGEPIPDNLLARDPIARRGA